MPQIEFSSPEHARGELLCLMMYPDDEDARRRAFVAGEVDRLTRDAQSPALMLPAAMARDLLDAPSYADMKADQRIRTKEAFVAGDILAGVYIMDRFGMSPSLNRSFHAYRNYAKTTEYGDGSAIPISEPKMRACWSKYGPVAPLWAAITLNKSYAFAPDRGAFMREHMDAFLGVAAGIRDFAVTFVPKHTRGNAPILDPTSTWAMPAGTVPMVLKSDRFPEKLAAFLQDYKAPLTKAYGT